jgi:antitoxin ParD1/3/4
MPRSYALGEHFEAFVRKQVKSGRYNNASEVVRAGLRLLEDGERLRELKLAELRRLVEEGRRSGEGNAAEDVFARLDAKYRAMAERV